MEVIPNDEGEYTNLLREYRQPILREIKKQLPVGNERMQNVRVIVWVSYNLCRRIRERDGKRQRSNLHPFTRLSFKGGVR